MSYHISELEIDSVSALPDARRYAHFLKRVADAEELWSLRGAEGDWVLAVGDEGRELVPVWPHPRYAEACAVGAWAGGEPEAIPLAAWLSWWLPGMGRDGRAASVFPVPGADGVVTEAEQMQADLDAALEPYE